jgi:hypothetical protein
MKIKQHIPKTCSSLLWLGACFLFISACTRSSIPGVDETRVVFESVDPGHAVFSGVEGATDMPYLIFNYGEVAIPDWEFAEIVEVAPNGAFKVVFDATPGSSITVWASTSADEATARLSSPLVLQSDVSALPQLSDSGTPRPTPGLDPTKITAHFLDDHHVLVLGFSGAATGVHLATFAGSADAAELESAQKRPLHEDGSFRFVLDLYRGNTFTLWAVGEGESSVQSEIQAVAMQE